MNMQYNIGATISGQMYQYRVIACQVSSVIISGVRYQAIASTGVRHQVISIAWQVLVYIYQGQVTNMSVRVTTSNIRYQPVT